MQSAGLKAGSDEGEVVSTIAIATSAIVTTAIIALGVLLLSQIRPFLESPALQPAFDNILPALFGGLAVVYVSRNWKIAAAPLVFMIVLFICIPSLSSSVGVLVPVGALIAIGVARLLYKKGLL
jgi:homoserine kinase